jgi:NAD(P)-dependent dehydrogenase (short-subunit alcohol dehydrogenase family)
MLLQDQVAMVTGAGRNIGEAIAKILAVHGAKVAVVDVDPGRGQKVTEEIRNTGQKAICVLGDVSKTHDVTAMIKRVVSEWGKINILVNNAAITDDKDILNLTEEEWDSVIAVTLKGPFLVAKHVAEQMVRQGQGGKIVNIASTSGHFGRPNATAYCAAKGGILNLTRAMAVQLAPYHIRVNSITPNRSGSPVGQDSGAEDRPFKNLVGRLGTPTDQARAVLFLVSDESAFITGANLPVDGGVLAMGAG